MKIKIGNFNFINDMENKLRSFSDFQYKDNYFWLDGKEDTLFVTNITKFENENEESYIPEFEKNLKSKYKIIHIYGELRKQVNEYINNKTEQFFKYRNYSKYELYKDMELKEYRELNNNSKLKLCSEDSLLIDIEKNKINIGKFKLNPYTEKIENLDEIYEQGVLNNYIKTNLILKEIEKGIAPPYVYELKKIESFLREKKSVNLIFKNCEKFKCEAKTSDFLKIRDRKFKLDLGYGVDDNFEKENPTMKAKDLKLEDFRGISYGKNILDVDGRIFTNANKQIAITLDDRLKQKIDCLKEDIKEEYCSYRNKEESQYSYVPYTLESAISSIKDNENRKEKTTWHTKELDEIIHKNNLINLLEQAKTIEDIKEVCVELGDNELQNIYYGMLYEEENYEEEEEENYQ